jgi:hypothetical protein
VKIQQFLYTGSVMEQFSKGLSSNEFVISYLHTLISSFILVTDTYAYTNTHTQTSTKRHPLLAIMIVREEKFPYYAARRFPSSHDIRPKIAANKRWRYIGVVLFPVHAMKAYRGGQRYSSIHSQPWH